MLTAYGVFQGMRAAAEVDLGRTDTRRAAPSASPGSARSATTSSSTCSRTAPAVVVTDVVAAGDRARAAAHPEVGAVASAAELVAQPLDVYAPCALGGALTDEVVEVLQARIVCGAANNQLAHDGVEKLLADAGILYAPDYCVNSGGLIQVADELAGFDFERAKARATGIFDDHPRGVPDRCRRSRSRRRSPPTASPSAGWPRPVAASSGSGPR